MAVRVDGGYNVVFIRTLQKMPKRSAE